MQGKCDHHSVLSRPGARYCPECGEQLSSGQRSIQDQIDGLPSEWRTLYYLVELQKPGEDRTEVFEEQAYETTQNLTLEQIKFIVQQLFNGVVSPDLARVLAVCTRK
jgi:hypothetical protein